MKKYLIKTNNSLILVSDEFIEEGDYGINSDTKEIKMYDGIKGMDSYWKKVISQTPNLSKEVADEIGWIDVKELAYEYYNSNEHYKVIDSFHYIKGFQKANELNQKKYTKKDMLLFADKIAKLQFEGNLLSMEKPFNEFIQSLSQHQQYEVEATEINGEWIVNKLIK